MPATSTASRKPRKPRRVFMWTFIAIQLVFVLWLVGGIATVHTGPTHADLASVCYHHNWYPLFKSRADCVTHYGHALQSAGNVGKGVGVALVIALWVAVDVILGVGRMVVVFSRRRSQPQPPQYQPPQYQPQQGNWY